MNIVFYLLNMLLLLVLYYIMHIPIFNSARMKQKNIHRYLNVIGYYILHKCFNEVI